MDALIRDLAGIAEFFKSIFEFFGGLIEDLVYMVKVLGEFTLQLPIYFTWLPAPFAVSLMTIFTIVVIYKVIGREG